MALMVEAGVTLARMERELTRLVSMSEKAARQSENAFTRSNKRIEQSYNSLSKVQERINKITGSGGSGIGRSDILSREEHIQQLDRLRSKFDPVYAASKRYEASLNELNRAQALGVLTTRQHEMALDMLNAEYTQFTTQQLPNNPEKYFKRSGFAVANLSAQLNDIGVSLAGGQSPFQVMIQQGTQVSQIFQQTGGNFKEFMGLLKGSIAGILNPFSIATFALIGLGGAALQWFTKTEEGASAAEKALERVDSVISDMKANFDDAGEVFSNVVKELASSDTMAVLMEEARDQAQKLLDVEMTKLEQKFEYIVNTVGDEFGEIWIEANEGVKDHQAEVFKLFNDYKKGEITANELIKAVSKIKFDESNSSAMRDFAKEITIAGEEADKLSRKILAASAALTELRREDTSNRVPMTMALLQRMNPELFDDLRDDIKNQNRDKYGVGKRTRKAPKTPEQKFSEEMQQREAAIRTMQAELDILREINPLVDDYGYALELATTRQELLNEAEKDGLKLKPEQIAAIEQLAVRHASMSAELEKQKELNDRVKESFDDFKSTGQDVFGGFLKDLRNGVDATQALENALGKLQDKLMDIAIQSIFQGPSGSSGNFLQAIASMFTGGGGPLNLATGQRTWADGGYTGPGGRNDAAGIVHRGEYVFDQAATRRIGVPALAALQKGYANGGYVGAHGAIGPGGGFNVQVINNRANDTKVSTGVDGRGMLRVVVDAVKTDYATGGFDQQRRQRDAATLKKAR